MRLITLVLFLGLLCLAAPICSATSIATTGAYCGGSSNSGQGSASCSFGGHFTAATAVANYVLVEANGSTPPPFGFGATGDYQTDAYLTLFGATGPGFANFFYAFYLGADRQDNGYLLATVNGNQVFYFDSGRQNPFIGGGIPIVYGQPTLVHLGLTASVSSNARPNSPGSLWGSLSLDHVLGSGNCVSYPFSLLCETTTYQYTLTEVPEPGYSALLAIILVLGIIQLPQSRSHWQARLRRAA